MSDRTISEAAEPPVVKAAVDTSIGFARAEAERYRDVLRTAAEALHYFGAHNEDSPRHAAWVALDDALGPADVSHDQREREARVLQHRASLNDPAPL